MRQVRFAPGPDRKRHPAALLADTPGAGLLAATLAMLLAAPAARSDDAPSPPAGTPSKPGAVNRLDDVVVTVDGYQATGLSLAKYPGPLLTTPQTATVVTTQLMEDQGVSSLRDSLRNVSGISIGAGEGSYQGDNFSIRGFAARSDMFLDGMSDWGNYNRDPFNTEEVEVLKGPSSAEFGRGAAGGAVNTESKAPQLQGFAILGLQAGTDMTRRATVDFDTPVSGLDGAALRVNAMVHKAEIADRPGPFYSRWGIAPSVAFGLETPTRLTLSYFFEHQNDLPDFGIPWILNRPAPVARDAYYGFTDGSNFFHADVNIGTLKLEHDFNDRVSMREQFRVSNYHRALQISQGDPPDGITLSTPLSSIVVDRTQIDGVSTDRSVDEALDLYVKFATGRIKHSVDLGGEYLRQTVDPRRVEPCWDNVPPTPLLHPSPSDPFTGVPTVAGQTCTNIDAHVDNLSAYVIDTMKWGDAWTFTAAARVDHVTSAYAESSPATILAFEPGPLVLNFTAANTLPSFRAAAIYQPQKNGSVYVSAGTSVHPNVAQVSISSEAPLIPPPDFNLEPVGRNVEVEVGTKWQFADGRLSFNAAIYWDQLRNPAPVDVDDPLNFVSGGRERVEGVELGFAGHLTDAWQLLLNYTYQDGTVTGSSDPTLLGHQVLNSPRNSSSAWTTYDLTARIQVGAGANQVSARTAGESPDPLTGRIQEAAGYVVGSVMGKFRVSDRLSAQANVTNLTNRYYYDGVHPGHVVPGPGRTLLVSAGYRF